MATDIPFCLRTADASNALSIKMFRMLMQCFDWENFEFKKPIKNPQ
jgi:hypothetical protein